MHGIAQLEIQRKAIHNSIRFLPKPVRRTAAIINLLLGTNYEDLLVSLHTNIDCLLFLEDYINSLQGHSVTQINIHGIVSLHD